MAHDPQHFVSGATVVGGEHRAERGKSHIEAGVAVGQCFGVGHFEVDPESLGAGAR
ncbi:hypothetical protein J2X04_002167 [Lysobacter niabensis]|uniref:Uncharacterized protein n=1 Tax=Agrilutibacter niabensis TaxID=380628 RepID=A0ABU1VQL8_9GAMM|nr:hypothetical protein [Lysobacter niabensis]MDR7099786.1 hypothetical protein [Lysobacter niabensis]